MVWAYALSVDENEPLEGIDEEGPLAPLLVGGLAAAWAEHMDASNVEGLIFPRLAAVAERLWSPRAVNDTTSALSRIKQFRCRLNSRGVAASPVETLPAPGPPDAIGDCLDE
eukprot:SAG31_NODE_315_length_17848_cov_18.145811_7_plen_112_part_00